MTALQGATWDEWSDFVETLSAWLAAPKAAVVTLSGQDYTLPETKPDAVKATGVFAQPADRAAGYSAAGVLRWYMALAAFAAALCTAGVLGIPLRVLGRGIGAVLRLPSRILHRFAPQPLRRRRAAGKTTRKLRRNAERTAKKSKKNLPNQRALLYNSNVSK